jgi:hypothetical protein
MLTAALITTIPLPGIPTVAAYNAGTKKAYFGCQTQMETSAGVAVVDDSTNTVVGTIITSNPVTNLVANATTKMIYGVELDQLDVIDSATDTITAMVKTPDGSAIAGLAVDETRNRIYVIASNVGGAGLSVLDGAQNTLGAATSVLLRPTGTPPIAVDATTQRVFVLGVDSNSAGLVVTLDGTSGIPQSIASTKSQVSPAVSGIVSLGDGTAAILLVSPSVVKHLGHVDVALPTTFTPTGITGGDVRSGPSVIVVGFGSDGQSLGYGVDTSTGAVSPFSLALAGGLPLDMVAAEILTAEAITSGSEVYIDLKPNPSSGVLFGPAETIKIRLTRAP